MNRSTNRRIAQAVALVSTFGMLALLLLAGQRAEATGGVEATNEVPRWMTRVCYYEDSVNCQWNAGTSGNGRGDSFYVRRMPGTNLVCTIYIDRPRKDNCVKDKR